MLRRYAAVGVAVHRRECPVQLGQTPSSGQAVMGEVDSLIAPASSTTSKGGDLPLPAGSEGRDGT